MLVMIAGGALYISEYRYWFALRDYRVEAESRELEARLWQIFPRRSLTFWPHFLNDKDGIKDFLERDMPVSVDTVSRGSGKFTTRINWLKAWVKVEWRGSIWCISRDGRMWLYDPDRPIDAEAGRLIWKVQESESAQTGSVPMSGVFRSPISTEVIAAFLDEFRGCKWFEAADEMTWQSREGMDLFVLKMGHENQRFELYLQRGKYAGQDVGAVLDSLFLRLIDEGGNHIIDATYEGKILLRKL